MADNSNFRKSNDGLNDRRGQEWFEEAQKMSEAVEKLEHTIFELNETLGGKSSDSFFSQASKKLFGVGESRSTKFSRNQDKELQAAGMALGKVFGDKVGALLDKHYENQLKKLGPLQRISEDLNKLKDAELKDRAQQIADEKGLAEMLRFLRENKDPKVRRKFKSDLYEYAEKKWREQEAEEAKEKAEHEKSEEKEKRDKDMAAKAAARHREGKRGRRQRIKQRGLVPYSSTTSADEEERQATEAEREQEEQEEREVQNTDALTEISKILGLTFSPGGIFDGWRKEFKKGNHNIFSGLVNTILGSVGTIIGGVMKGFAPQLLKVLTALSPLLLKVAAVVGTAVLAFKAGEFLGNKIVEYMEDRDELAANAARAGRQSARAETGIKKIEDKLKNKNLSIAERRKTELERLEKDFVSQLAETRAKAEASHDPNKQSELAAKYAKLPAGKAYKEFISAMADTSKGVAITSEGIRAVSKDGIMIFPDADYIGNEDIGDARSTSARLALIEMQKASQMYVRLKDRRRDQSMQSAEDKMFAENLQRILDKEKQEKQAKRAKSHAKIQQGIDKARVDAERLMNEAEQMEWNQSLLSGLSDDDTMKYFEANLTSTFLKELKARSEGQSFGPWQSADMYTFANLIGNAVAKNQTPQAIVKQVVYAKTNERPFMNSIMTEVK